MLRPEKPGEKTGRRSPWGQRSRSPRRLYGIPAQCGRVPPGMRRSAPSRCHAGLRPRRRSHPVRTRSLPEAWCGARRRRRDRARDSQASTIQRKIYVPAWARSFYSPGRSNSLSPLPSRYLASDGFRAGGEEEIFPTRLSSAFLCNSCTLCSSFSALAESPRA